jgi:hypothetical protein
MWPDERRTDPDRRLRELLRPSEDRVRAVITRAFSSEPRRRASWRLHLVLGAAVVLLVIGTMVWRPSSRAPAWHISGSGAVVVVTSDDGMRWVVAGQRDADARGHYVIAVPR